MKFNYEIGINKTKPQEQDSKSSIMLLSRRRCYPCYRCYRYRKLYMNEMVSFAGRGIFKVWRNGKWGLLNIE